MVELLVHVLDSALAYRLLYTNKPTLAKVSTLYSRMAVARQRLGWCQWRGGKSGAGGLKTAAPRVAGLLFDNSISSAGLVNLRSADEIAQWSYVRVTVMTSVRPSEVRINKSCTVVAAVKLRPFKLSVP